MSLFLNHFFDWSRKKEDILPRSDWLPESKRNRRMKDPTEETEQIEEGKKSGRESHDRNSLSLSSWLWQKPQRRRRRHENCKKDMFTLIPFSWFLGMWQFLSSSLTSSSSSQAWKVVINESLGCPFIRDAFTHSLLPLFLCSRTCASLILQQRKEEREREEEEERKEEKRLNPWKRQRNLLDTLAFVGGGQIWLLCLSCVLLFFVLLFDFLFLVSVLCLLHCLSISPLSSFLDFNRLTTEIPRLSFGSVSLYERNSRSSGYTFPLFWSLNLFIPWLKSVSYTWFSWSCWFVLFEGWLSLSCFDLLCPLVSSSLLSLCLFFLSVSLETSNEGCLVRESQEEEGKHLGSSSFVFLLSLLVLCRCLSYFVSQETIQVNLQSYVSASSSSSSSGRSIRESAGEITQERRRVTGDNMKKDSWAGKRNKLDNRLDNTKS